MPDEQARSSRRDRLTELLETASDEEIRFVLPMLRRFRRHVEQRVASDEFVSPDFAREFEWRLRFFHASHHAGEVLKKKTFEFAFEAACRAAGLDASISRSATVPGSDIIVAGEGYSLKTEASASIRRHRITISKLMESAWTKQCGCIDDFIEGNRRIVQHLSEYGRIICLRVFGRLNHTEEVTYDLVEIPKEIFVGVETLGAEDYGPMTRAGGTRAEVRHNGRKAFDLVYDGSDQKITIRNLAVDLCKPHASWTLKATGTE